MKEEGKRYDAEKLRMDLIPPEVLIAFAQVATYGAGKYGDHNWEKGMAWSRMIASLMRHLTEFQMGKDYDDESGLPHVYHIMWNASALATYYMRQSDMDGFDDRQSHHDFDAIREFMTPNHHKWESAELPAEEYGPPSEAASEEIPPVDLVHIKQAPCKYVRRDYAAWADYCCSDDTCASCTSRIAAKKAEADNG